MKMDSTSSNNQTSSQKLTDIAEVKMALKRSRHFTQGLSFDGPFHPCGVTGLSIPIRNGLWFIDLVITNPPPNLTLEEEIGGELLAIIWMAKSINRWIDGHLVENDEEAKWALAAWLVRADAFADFSKLEEL